MDLSPQKVHQIKHNSQLLGGALFSVDDTDMFICGRKKRQKDKRKEGRGRDNVLIQRIISPYYLKSIL